MKYKLFKFFGLQRSGNHAVINWLLRLDEKNILFFNMVEAHRRPSEKTFCIYLPEKNVRAYTKRIEGEKVVYLDELSLFMKVGGILLCSYENARIQAIINNEERFNLPIKERFKYASKQKSFLLLRNPFNMLPSAAKMLQGNNNLG